MIVEVFFEDLAVDKQEELLEAYNIKKPEELNWDINALFSVNTGDDSGLRQDLLDI